MKWVADLLVTQDGRAKFFDYLGILLLTGAAYTSGVLYRIPDSIVELAGSAIIRRTIADAAISATLAILGARVITLFLFPVFYFYFVRAFIAMLFSLRNYFLRRRISRISVKALDWGDWTFAIAARHTRRISLIISLFLFIYISTRSLVMSFAFVFFASLALGLASMSYLISEGRVRIKFRRKHLPYLRSQSVSFGLASAVAFGAFFGGGIVIDQSIKYGDKIKFDDTEARFTIVAATDLGIVIARPVAPADGTRNSSQNIDWRYIPYPLDGIEVVIP
ncbi:MAG: hypothetical protein IAE87_05845 [Rhodobacteraceae bacterium]|nr:hypothetical protein [Paracoccaceae bacterium]